MIDIAFRFAVSNLCVSIAVAVVAWAVHRTGKRPVVAHLLWVLVLAKLVTPPIITLPMVPLPGSAVLTAGPGLADEPLAAASVAVVHGNPETLAAPEPNATTAPSVFSVASLVQHGRLALIAVWVLGSAGVLTWSLVRIYRFNRLLSLASEPAPPQVQRLAAQVAGRLGLKSTPLVYAISARLSPMVWWIGGRVRIVIPATLPDELGPAQLRWVLAHELAHVRRRDHLVRWLEWMACVCFWWNPVAWWRATFRVNEEILCDTLVLAKLNPKPLTYANALMMVLEFLARPVIRPPAMASEINSGGFLERRFKMIVSSNALLKTPRWMAGVVLLAAVALLPLGIAYAQERQTDAGLAEQRKDADATWRRVAGALTEAEIERESIRTVMGAMKRIVHEVRSEGDAFKLDPRLHGYLVELGLTDEQIELVVGLSRRVAASDVSMDEKRDDADAIWRRVAGALTEAEIERESIRTVMGAMKRIVHEVRSEGDAFKLDPRLHEYLVELGLADEQIELVLRLSRRVAASDVSMDEKRDDADAIWRRVAGALTEAEIERESIRTVMGAMKRIVHEVRSEGDAFKLDPGVHGYLVELGLADEQIELVLRLSRRVAASDALRGADIDWRRIEGALAEAGIERELIRDVMGTMKRIIPEIKAEGEAFELNPEVLAHLVVGLGLTDEQIDVVVGLSRRLARAQRANQDTRLKWEGIRARIEGAVERGDMTREEADAKYLEIKKRMDTDR